MEAALYDYDNAGSTKDRAIAATALAEAVREHLEGDQPATGISYAASSVWNVRSAKPGLFDKGLYIYNKKFPVSIDHITYPTAMNAFQAMKASSSDRVKYTTCDWSQATNLGRYESIDVEAWDANRENLMHSILVTQANQHSAFKKLVIKYGDKGLHENSMTDFFWPTALPGIWRSVRKSLIEDGEEEDDDESDDGEEAVGDEQEEGDEEEEGEEDDDDAAEAAEIVRQAKKARRLR